MESDSLGTKYSSSGASGFFISLYTDIHMHEFFQAVQVLIKGYRLSINATSRQYALKYRSHKGKENIKTTKELNEIVRLLTHFIKKSFYLLQ